MNSLAKALSLLFQDIKPVSRSITQDTDTYLTERYLIISDKVRFHLVIDTKISALNNVGLADLDLPKLNKLLEEAIEKEDYARASEIRDVLERLGEDEDNL